MTSPCENTFYHFQNQKEIHQFNNRAPHIHDFYELLIVLDGEIHQQIEQSDLVFHSGNCCLMNHNIVHKEVFSSDATLFIYRYVKRTCKTTV
ncbi:MAG: AraC family ligand binding domain-containing protein [Mediterraneibacter faecis]